MAGNFSRTACLSLFCAIGEHAAKEGKFHRFVEVVSNLGVVFFSRLSPEVCDAVLKDMAERIAEARAARAAAVAERVALLHDETPEELAGAADAASDVLKKVSL